jgi:hypothetical protein
MTLFFVPQWPTPNRYPEEWIKWFPQEFRKHEVDFELVVPRHEFYELQEKGSYDTFSNLYNASRFELEQCARLIDKVIAGDTVFFADLDYPGFSVTCAQLLRRMYGDKIKIYGYMHAGSYCKGDYFEPIKDSKWDSETAMFKIVDGIFVGSEYHKQKLVFHLSTHLYAIKEDYDKVHVVGVPYYPNDDYHKPISERKWDVAYTSRMDVQKTDKYLLSLAKKMSHTKFVCTSKPSKELPNLEFYPVKNRQEYHYVLENSKIVFVPIAESTFGYNVLEALDYQCIPICPNGFSYPEFVPKEFLYSNDFRVSRVSNKIKRFINDDSLIDFNFSPYRNCISKMLEVMDLV